MVEEHRFSWLVRIDAWLLACILFVLMLVFIWVGAIVGRWKKKGLDYQENKANNTIHGALLGLLAFLLAITFSMSGSRYDNRRLASITEANHIHTAILRADLYPDSVRAALRDELKHYVQARIDNLKAGPDLPKVIAAEREATHYAQLLWKRAIGYSKINPAVVISGQMVPALNNMFDSALSNTYSELMRVPTSIVVMLFLLSWTVAFFVGYSSVDKGKFDWFAGLGFCLLSALVVYITLDVDRPRRGLIKMDTSHEAIFHVMEQFEQAK